MTELKRRRLGWLPGAIALAAIAALPVAARSGYLASTGSQIGIHAIIAVGLGLPPIAAMLGGVLLTAAIALIVGAPALRLHGHYLAMFTLGLGIIVQIVLEQAKGLTNGFDGITGIPPFGLGPLQFKTDAATYGLVVAALAGTILVARNLVESRRGRALRALHESEEAASACGVDVARAKLEVFVLSAVMASIAGSLYAHVIGFVSPDPFGFRFSVQLVVMVVVGGSASVWGPLAGATLFTVLAQVLQDAGERVRAVADLDTVLFGAVLVLVIIFAEKGLASLRWWDWLRLRKRERPEEGA